MRSRGCNHPFVDGNKRLAMLATVVFLSISGHRLDGKPVPYATGN